MIFVSYRLSLGCFGVTWVTVSSRWIYLYRQRSNSENRAESTGSVSVGAKPWGGELGIRGWESGGVAWLGPGEMEPVRGSVEVEVKENLRRLLLEKEGNWKR